jgi:hypothetical protein
VTRPDEDSGLDPDEIRAGLVELGVDPDSARGQQLFASMQQRHEPTSRTLALSGIESADEVEAVQAAAVPWLNEIVDILVAHDCRLEPAVPYLVKAGREDLLRTEGLCLDGADRLGQTVNYPEVEAYWPGTIELPETTFRFTVKKPDIEGDSDKTTRTLELEETSHATTCPPADRRVRCRLPGSRTSPRQDRLREEPDGLGENS